MEHAGVSPSCEPLPHMSSANKETKSHSSLRIHDDHFIWLEEWLCARLKRKIIFSSPGRTHHQWACLDLLSLACLTWKVSKVPLLNRTCFLQHIRVVSLSVCQNKSHLHSFLAHKKYKCALYLLLVQVKQRTVNCHSAFQEETFQEENVEWQFFHMSGLCGCTF